MVFDRSGNRLVECPTEDEAVEWIDEHINNSRFDCEKVVDLMISYNCYSVGDSLRELRKCHRLTQNEMAERLDI